MTAVPLTRLLTRLDATLLSPTSTLPNTAPHRARIAANLEHARALYLVAEKSITTTQQRGPAQQQRRQQGGGGVEELARWREWIGRLERRLRELEMETEEDESSSEEDEDGQGREDLLRAYGPARRGVEGAGLDVGGASLVTEEGGNVEEGTQPAQASQQSELRSRKPILASDNRSAATSSAREALFSAARSPQSTQGQWREEDSLHKTETLLSHHRNEQEALTTGLLGLASALKQSSINFSSSLEAERDVMKRAEGGLDKSAQGMEAAGKKMGTLRRMSEGQGWWGRIKLYAFIFGLWMACFLLVFIGPKLRF